MTEREHPLSEQRHLKHHPQQDARPKRPSRLGGVKRGRRSARTLPTAALPTAALPTAALPTAALPTAALPAAVALLIIVMTFVSVPALSADDGAGFGRDDAATRLYYFWGDGCPVCERQAGFLDRLEERHPELQVERFEVWYDEDNLEVLRGFAERLGFEVRGVPVTVVGDRHWVGFNAQFAEQIEAEVAHCLKHRCPDPAAELLPADRRAPRTGTPEDTLRLPLLGELDLTAQPIILVTTLIAFIDGFNPCSLWVLTMLLALVVYTRSRLKTLIVGFTFLIVTAAVYGGFIAGVFSVFAFVHHLGWVRAVTAGIAFVFGVANLKDFFRFGRGVSFTISAGGKRSITARIREMVRGERSAAGMIAVTAAMAAGIALVELPCTAGFPIIWSGIIAERGVAGTAFIGLLSLYILVYLLIELAVFFTALFGLRSARMTEDYARVLKLFGGVIMIALAAVLVFLPDAMMSLRGSLIVFAGALTVGALILAVHHAITRRKSGS